MKYIIYPTRIKNGNLGDILINSVLVRELSKYYIVCFDGFNSELEKFSKFNNPFSNNIKSISGIKLFYGLPVLRWFNLLRILNSTKLIFDPPGHYPSLNNKFVAYTKIVKYFLRAFFLKSFNVGVVRAGVTLGPFNSLEWSLYRYTCSLYADVCVRDLKNLSVAKSHRIKNISFIDDLAFLFNSDEFNSHLLSQHSFLNEKYIVISFRGDIYSSALNQDYFSNLANSLTFLINSFFANNFQLVLSYQVDEDLEVIQKLKSSFDNHGFSSVIIYDKLDLLSASSLYSNASFVLTNRLHVGLLSLLNNTASIILTDLAKHHKLVNVYRDLELDELLVDIDNPTVSKFSYSYFNNALDRFGIIKVKKQNEIKSKIKSILAVD